MVRITEFQSYYYEDYNEIKYCIENDLLSDSSSAPETAGKLVVG